MFVIEIVSCLQIIRQTSFCFHFFTFFTAVGGIFLLLPIYSNINWLCRHYECSFVDCLIVGIFKVCWNFFWQAVFYSYSSMKCFLTSHDHFRQSKFSLYSRINILPLLYMTQYIQYLADYLITEISLLQLAATQQFCVLGILSNITASLTVFSQLIVMKHSWIFYHDLYILYSVGYAKYFSSEFSVLMSA